MPLYLSVLKLTGSVTWRNGTTGTFIPLNNCQSFDTAATATAQFRLRTNDASIEIHQFESPMQSPPCPVPHKGSTMIMVLNRDPANLKKRRGNLTPRSRKALGASGKRRELKRGSATLQSVQTGGGTLEIRT